MYSSATDRTAISRWAAAVLLLIMLPVAGSGAAPPISYGKADLKALQRAFVKLAENVLPSVVSIKTYNVRDVGHHRQGQIRVPLRALSKGSGFIIDGDGLIVTNHHVIEGADVVSVILHNGLSYEARVVQSDSRIDLAVLEIEEHHLLSVRWGSLDRVKVNQWAFACGNPFGLAIEDGRASVAFGVVSGLGRQLTHRIADRDARRYYGNLIETTAAVNPGSSGGPLFNVDGEVIGVITAVETSSGANQGLGFAIPIDKNVKRIIETLKTGKPVRYGFLGVLVRDPQESAPFVRGRVRRGAQIDTIILADGPAARADLRPNDIITEFDGVAVENYDHFVRLVSFAPVGLRAQITYFRDNVQRKTVVTLGDREELLGHARRAGEPPRKDEG